MSALATEIRALGRADVTALHGLRLEALMRHPEAFGGSFAQEARMAPEAFARLFLPNPPGTMIGAFAGNQLAGMFGMSVPTQAHRRHRGMIFGVYVQPLHRNHGLAGQMLDMVISRARSSGMELLALTVTSPNEPARRLYLSRGFVPTGLAPRALKLGLRYFDEELMQLDLSRS